MDSERVLKILEEIEQKEIIEKFKSVSPQEQKGGLKNYLKKAKSLLEDSKNRVNTFHEYTIKIPDDFPHIDIDSDEFYELEQLGFDHLKTQFLL